MRFFINLIVILFGLTLPTLKVLGDTYKPTERKEQQQTQSTTNRGCSQSVARFKLLAPSDHIAKTALEQPTFLFWVDEIPQSPFKVSITQPWVESALWESTVYVQKKGIFSLKLPKSLKLKEGDYVLTTELSCSTEPDSSSYVRVAFQKISPNETDSTKYLAERGIWYDLLAESWKTSKTEFYRLLEQIGIKLSDESF